MPRRGENIRKRKDGRWEGRYIKGYDSAKGKAKYASIYGKTYSEVKKKMNEAKFQTSIGRVYVDAKNMLFGEIVNNWFGIVKINLKPSSINKYQNLIENHVLPELGHYKLKDLNSDTLHGFLEKQGSTGNKKNGGSLSISTLQTLLYILNSSIKYAASNNMIALFSVHLLGGGKSAAPISCLSEKDESALDTYLSAHLSCRNMGIMLSLYCGLRIGEVCGLQWADIDFEHKLISIKRTVQRIRVASGQRKTKLWVGTPKSKSSIRTIPIPDFLMSALYALSAQSCSDAYILTRTDEPLDPRTLQYYFNKVTISCGIGKINYHSFCKKDQTVLIGCADNRSADVYANSISVMYGIPFLSIGFWERAFAGEIILQSLCLGTRSEMRNVDNAYSCQYASVDVSSIE